MSIELGPELRQRIWAELDWSQAAPALAARVVESESMEPQVKAPFLRQLAELCEFCVLDPQASADLYGAAYQADRRQVQLLARMRHQCEAMGRSDHAARTAELEFRQTKDPRFHVIAGQAWLDAGEPDRALKPLLAADLESPGNPHVRAALEVAQREWANPERHAETLLDKARQKTADTPIQGLNAARILHMLDFADERFAEALALCLEVQPNLPSACNMIERFLFESERLEELAAHFQRRAQAAPNASMAARFLFQGSSLLFRAGAGNHGAPLFAAGLQMVAQTQLRSIPGLLAQLRAIVTSGADARAQVIPYAEQVWDRLVSIDEQVGVSIFCAQISWYAQKDFATAGRWMQRLKKHCSDHRLLVDFQLAEAMVEAKPAAPVAITPPSANPSSDKRRAPRVAVRANIELKIQVQDRMGAMSKIDAVTTDISAVGAQVRCAKELPLDQKMEIVLQLPSKSGLSKRRFTVKARVARIISGRGFALEWVDPDFDLKTAISTLPGQSRP